MRTSALATLLAALALVGCTETTRETPPVIVDDADPEKLGEGFRFTEGPAADADGNVVFSDVPASKRYRWEHGSGSITMVSDETHGGNGQAYDGEGNLLVCQHHRQRVVAIAPDGEVTVLADSYNGKPFNRPNDLWIAPDGGVYFTDPLYGGGEKPQGGEHVYYISPDDGSVLRVVDDMDKPNGLVGTPDGRTLYIADEGADRIYRYRIADDGRLTEKALFVERGSDGMAMDAAGNVYATDDAVYVYSPAGEQLARIALPHLPTNLCFAGPDGKLLFITARQAVYGIKTEIGRP
jgi:gluconolactonase